MNRTAGLAGVLLLAALVRLAAPPLDGGASATLALGFVLLVSYLLGGQAPRLALPAITGYLLVGMAFGPYLLGWVHPALAVLGHGAVSNLRLLDAVALGLIALTAGGELRLETLRAHRHAIGAVLLGQMGLVGAGLGGALLLLRQHFPSLAGLEQGEAVAAALLLGVIATANSPATALAVIQEARSSGPLTTIVLSVTVAKDVAVILLFSATLSVAVVLTGSQAGFSGDSWTRLAWELAGSIGLGVLLGLLVARVIVHLGTDLPLLVLGVAFVAVTVLPALHLSGILTCLVAGFVIENLSPHGERLIKAIERHSLPVYVVFFTIAGASLDLPALRLALPLAVFFVLARIALTAGGTALAARLSGAPRGVVLHGWSGFVAQAGVTLGFAALVEQRFPEIGETVRTATLAVVALNQLAGPALFRLGLNLAGEAGRAGENEEPGRS